MTKIKTTHVGSLPRADELSDLLFKKDRKEKIDLDNFDAVVKKDVKKIVKKQINLGVDFISDGEMSKISYATYVKDRIDGFSLQFLANMYSSSASSIGSFLICAK